MDVVVQWLVPNSLSIWYQRAGRAGRGTEKMTKAILLVQPSVFKEKNRGKRSEDSPADYVKTISKPLRDWVSTDNCRGEVADKFFDNPPVEMDFDPFHGKIEVCTLHFDTEEFG